MPWEANACSRSFVALATMSGANDLGEINTVFKSS